MSVRPLRLLLVEDERELALMLGQLLRDEGYAVTTVHDGQRALHQVLTAEWDLVVLDRGLPVVDGLEVLEIARSRGITTPMLVLTARGTVEDRVDGLDAGAADYMTKPFALDELLARLRSLRRRHLEVPRLLSLGVRMLDVEAKVVRGEPDVALTSQEARLLAHLAAEPRKVHPRGQLLAEVFPEAVSDAALDSYVSYLRRKLGQDCILTARGVGYRLGRT